MDGKHALFLVAGWNGFGQWSVPGVHIAQFTEAAPPGTVCRFSDAQFEWAYNVFIFGSKIFLTGQLDGKMYQVALLQCPDSQFQFTNCACNDKYILFYNRNQKYVWKYSLEEGHVVDRWTKITNFLGVDYETETVDKIVCSIRMNFILSSRGRVFNPPEELDCKEIIGKIIDIQCGYEHCMMLSDAGNVYTIGYGSRCQLGHGTTENCEEPTEVKALSGIRITKISCGGWHCCALSDTGDLYTWGWNDRGQLGIYPKHEAADVEPLPRGFGMCSPTVDREVLCNYALPTIINLFNDDNIQISNNVLDVSSGSKHTVIKLDDGTFMGTGCNKNAQLGFDHRVVSNVSHFKKLKVSLVNSALAVVRCSAWTTVLIDYY